MSNDKQTISPETTDSTLGWVLVRDSKNYFISRDGSLARGFENESFNLLSPAKHHMGYLKYNIIMKSGKRVTRTIHSLVAEAFIGPRPEHMVVNHKNGVKTDNRLENLEYVSRSENGKHAHRIGLHKHTKHSKGVESHNSRLTDSVVKLIYECQSVSYTELSRIFDINPSIIRLIKQGEGWKHISRGGVQLLLFPQLN